MLECKLLTPELREGFVAFLSALETAGDQKFFYPHPFTSEAVERLIGYEGKDLYYVLVDINAVLGYGMLRGWDEGFEIPSLGIAIHPQSRGQGLSKLLMHFLHVAAARRGASKVRLRVRHDNAKAIALYRSIGYKFTPDREEYLVGFFELQRD